MTEKKYFITFFADEKSNVEFLSTRLKKKITRA